MNGPTLIDTSVLVAALRETEAEHQLCVRAMKRLVPPAVTTWPVLTETIYMLLRRREAVASVISMVRDGTIRIEPLPQNFLNWYETFTATYADREVDLADASLVFVAERLGTDTILTLDRRDFSAYRIARTGTFRILPEPQ